MKTLLVLAALLVAASAAQLSASEVASHWRDFKTTHSKLYPSPAVEQYRQKVFASNLLRVHEHNARFDQGLETYKTAVNEYSDLLDHEASALLNGLSYDATTAIRKGGQVHFADPKSPALTHADWRKTGHVTDVKNQGQCGSCWAFSTTGAVEAQLFKKTGKLVSLSEQNLVDCSKGSNKGCHGGLMTVAFDFIRRNGGIQTEESYPYEAVDNRCRYNASLSAGTVTGYVEVNPTEKDLQHAVATVGPVAIGIDAGGWNFRHYSSGVFYDPASSSTNLNHGVLAVGFGNSLFQGDYWIVKNSWGKSWGEGGYVRIARNKKNHCGVATMASYPTV